MTTGGFVPPALRPGAFAFVMATGIVSTSIMNSGARTLAAVMFAVANVVYFTLIADVLARWFRGRRQVESGFMSLTFVAASGVLGSHFAFLGHRPAALAFVVVSLASWAVLGYTVAAQVVLQSRADESAPPHPDGSRMAQELGRVDGTWFLWVVATQAVAVVCGAYATEFAGTGLAVVAALCWSVGVMQFLLVAGLVFSRLALHRIDPREPVAPYWIFMGSAAITVLSGAQILGLSSEQSLLESAVVATVSMVLWSFATWLIPLLVGLFVWQQARRPGLPRFHPAWWSMVFPIGMYGESSRQLGAIRDTGWLEDVGRWESWIALGVWAVVCLAALARLWGTRPGRRRTAG